MLGAISGVASSTVPQVLDFLIHKSGVTDVTYGPSAANIFLTKKQTKTSGGLLTSAIINMINAGVVATSIVYTLSLTGKDKAVVKGAGVGALMWVSLAGLLFKVGLGKKSKNPKSPLINLSLHLLFGALCGYTISKLGDDSLFPDKDFKKREKIPVVYTGNNETADSGIIQRIH